MKIKMKVLQVIPRLGYGGAETGCYDLAHFLAEENCKSFIVTSGGELLKYIKKKSVKVFRLPVHSKNPVLIFFNSLIISLIIILYNINIVHARSRAPAWSCFIATKLTMRKFVTTFHGTYNFNNKFKKFYNSVMVRSHLVIAGSNFIFSHIKSYYENFFRDGRRKLLVIFRGINTNYFHSNRIPISKIDNFSNKYNIDRNKFIILMPGRLTNWKGQKLFIESLKLVLIHENSNMQPFQAIILGDEQGRSVYKKQLIDLVQQYRLGRFVKFINRCDEMPIAYSISNLVCSCSIEPETFGRVAVEAQSMEVPIIASDIGGSTETIIKDKTGFLFKRGDVNNLANTILMVMQKDYNSLKSIGLEGRKNVLKKFDVNKMCSTTFAEYKKLIELS
jgi:glycosyltransferase involved in cell wall biosynthesis